MVEAHTSRLDSTSGNASGDKYAVYGYSAAGANPSKFEEYIRPASGAGRDQHQPQTQSESSNCLVELGKSTVNAAIVDPTRAVAQIIDNSLHTNYEKKIQGVANSVGLAPSAPAEFGTARYFGQQLGSAVGMMVPFMLLRGGGGAVADGVLARSRSTLAAVEETTLRAPGVMKLATNEALASGATGLAYGTFLRPTEDQSSNSGFWVKRAHQGVSDMATFGLLGFTAPIVGKSLNSLASSVERSTAEGVAKTALSETLRSPITSGTLASVPAGLLNAEMQARGDGRWLPTGTELKENLVTMAFVGGAFGGAHSLYSRAARSNDKSNLSTIKSDSSVETKNQTNVESPNTLRQFETPEIAHRQFTNFIETSNWSKAAEVVSTGMIEPATLKAEPAVQAVRAGLDVALEKSNWADISSIIKLGVLAPEQYRTPAIKQKALDAVSVFIMERMPSHLTSVLDTNILTAGDLRQSPEVRNASVMTLSRSLGDTAERLAIYRNRSWVDASVMHDSAIRAIDEVVAWRDLNGISEITQKVRDMNLLTEAEVKKAGQEALLRRIEGGSWENLAELTNHFYGSDWAQHPDVRIAASNRLQKDLVAGKVDSSVISLQQNLVPSDLVRTEANKQLAIDGFNKALLDDARSLKLVSSQYDKITEVFGRPSPESIRSSAANAIRLFMKGNDDLRRYTDFAREKFGIEFSPEEIRAAGRKELTTHLKFWDISDANEIIEMKILTADDIKDAAARAIPESVDQNTAITRHLAKRFDVDEPRIRSALQAYADEGHITDTLRTAMVRGDDFNSALREYARIEKLSDESAKTLVERLKSEDPIWRDRGNVGNLFEAGVGTFGEAKMLRFAMNPRVNMHDALIGFDKVVEMYKKSGMTPEAFDGKILTQVSRDAGLDDHGTAFNRLQTVAKNFPENADDVLVRARESLPEIKTLADSFNDGVFSDWNTLQRFGKMQHLLEQTETLEKLKQLEDSGQTHFANWLKTLMFHPDSRISLDPIMQFWQDPAKFLDLKDANSGKAHGLKKPSNYTDIPNLDLTPVQLRDALIDGTLDKIQVFKPMRVEYDLAPAVDVNKAFDEALGSRKEQRKGTAKNAQKLFSEVTRALKSDAPGYSINDLVSGKEPPVAVHAKLMDLLYNGDIGIPKPDTKMRLIAEIHRKSDPIAVLAGDDTASCMGFGTGKNNIYMFNPNDAQFTVRIVNQEGKVRTFAQSVLTKDKDVKETVPKLFAAMQENNAAQVHELLSSDALRSEPSVIAADNIEVHPKYNGTEHRLALEAVYKDFFNRYLQEFGEQQNLRSDKIVIGIGYTDAMKHLPQEPNTYVPQAPVAYSDKTHETVYRLDMNRKSEWTATSTKVEMAKAKADAPQQQKPSSIEGIAPLTFEDTLPVAWLESKAYQDNPSMVEGLHNMENSLIAQAINNIAKDRPNMSLKYTNPDGTTQGYLVAYEGHYGDAGKEQPVVFVSDYSTDRQIGRNGQPKAGRAGGKLLQGFMEVYKREYLDKGDFTPVLANAREETSYKLLRNNLKTISRLIGYKFDVQEVGTHVSGTSVMHDVLIVPRK